MKKVFLFCVLLLVFGALPVHALDSWQKYSSRHVVIYYKDAPRDFVENVSEATERLYDEITHSFGFARYHGWISEDRVKIYIYKDREDYQKYAASHLAWSHGLADPRKKEIHTYPSMHGFFDSTLPHEMGHIIFREFIGVDKRLPFWLDEGAAIYQEKAKRWGANKVVKAAIENGKFVPLEEMTPDRLKENTSDEMLNIYYAQAASIVYYMIVELGETRFENFCRRLREGLDINEALAQSYGHIKNVEDLNARWMDFVKNQD